MNPFVRFIVTLLVVGGVVNLIIVLLANAHSQTRQRERMSRQKDHFVQIVSDVSGHPRRADFIVESQEFDAYGRALHTTLLVRQYQYAMIASDESKPMHTTRVVIPGNQVAVDGILLEPTASFAADAPDFQILRGTKLAYFGMICGKDEAPPAPDLPDPRFTYLPRYEVPQLTRIEPGDDQPGSYEVELWRYLWGVIPDAPPPARTATVRDLKVTWFKPQVIAVRREKTYTAYVSPDGLTLEEGAMPTIPGLFDEMLKQGKKLDESP